MKIKQLPEDFMVEEVSTVQIKDCGPYQVFALTKKGLDTLSAKRIVGAAFSVSGAEVGVAGLKDRHALTTQYVSFPSRVRIPDSWKQQSLELQRKGYADAPIRLGDLSVNRFRIVVRDIQEQEVASLTSRAAMVFKAGIPNYFDNQRFGSLRGSREFIAKHMVTGDYEGALRILLTSATRHDSAGIRRCRQSIGMHWGDWQGCLRACREVQKARRELKVVSYLVNHPSNFVGAWSLVPPEMIKLYLAAYQSYLWNETIKILLGRVSPRLVMKRIVYHAGDIVMPSVMPECDGLNREQEVPLVHHGMRFSNDMLRFAALKVLKKEGISLDALKLNHCFKQSFKGGVRRWWVVPSHTWIEGKERDELNSTPQRQRWKVRMGFDLPPGSYATMLLKAMGVAKKGRQH